MTRGLISEYWPTRALEYELDGVTPLVHENFVSSAKVQQIGNHDHVFVFIRSQCTGELIMSPGDGNKFVQEVLGLVLREVYPEATAR